MSDSTTCVGVTARLLALTCCGALLLSPACSSDSGSGSRGATGTGGDGAGGAPGAGGRATGGAAGGRMGSGGSGGAAAGGADAGAGTGGTPGTGGGVAAGGSVSESGGATSLDAGAGGSPVCGCPGACLADGGCAECVLHADCTDSGRTRCEPSTHTCVECLPGAEDTCTVGRYCGDSFVCVPGCKAGGAECASGVCTVDHDCAPCLGDTECGGQRACGSGACGSRCAAPGDCSGGATCCDTRCVSTGTDHRNCGGCGVACSPAQYCAPAGCRAAVVANLCDVGRVTFLTDGLGVDDIASGQAQAALTTACPAVTVRAVAASGTGLINPTTGQPVVGGGETLVTLGGPFGQYLLRYLEGGGISPVYSYEMPFGTFYGRAVADGGADPAIVGVSPSELTDTHDFFVAQMIRDPLSGTLTFSVYGMNVAGTRAATWFLANRVLADLASFDRAYYVYEWTDGDGNATAGAADTFTLVRSGP